MSCWFEIAAITIRVSLYAVVMVVAFRRQRWDITALSALAIGLTLALSTPSNTDNHIVGLFFAPLYALVMINILGGKKK